MGLDRAQLEALRRQIEEDYRLDLAALERLERRFVGANTTGAALAQAAAATPVPEAIGTAPGSAEARPGEADELTGSLRAMFSNYRK